MKLTRVIAIAVIAASGALSVVQAQTLRNAGEPAEFPPASFKGRQYVDSNGCVYIRAGIDGNVTWVPRVSRSRTLVCGYQPTVVARAEPGPVPAAKPAPKAAVVAQAKPKPEQVEKAQPKPPAVAKAQPVRKAAPQLVRPTATATYKPVVMQTAPAKKAMTKPGQVRKTRRVAAASPCRGLSAVSAQYLRGDNVRCGPQAEPPHDGAITPQGRIRVPARGHRTAPGATAPVAKSAARPVVTPSTVQSPPVRVAPKRVYASQRAATQGIHVPEGYKRVWGDGRLNPYRTHQYFDGKQRMDLIWTRTVPRQLVVRETGRVVTPAYPGLRYPYTSYAQQTHAGVPVVSSSGTVPARTKAVTRKAQLQSVAQPQAKTVRKAIEAASHSYVQAGVFATRAQAEQAGRRLARTGLTTRLGTLTRGNKSYSLVMAGPFRTKGALDAALARVRAAGFGNAKLR